MSGYWESEIGRIKHTTTVRPPPDAEKPEGPRIDQVGFDPILTSSKDPHHCTRLGRYSLLHRLGAGGMGRVYLARDPELNRNVAVKVILGTPNVAEASRLRLLREAQAMARLSHPNVVTVYDVGLSRLGIYVAMEFVDGKTLGAWVNRDKPSPETILKVCLGAGRGVAAAHAAGFVHRDLKPGNILVALGPGPNHAKGMVVDFGLVAAASHGSGPPGNAPTNTETNSADSAASTLTAGVLDLPLTEEGVIVGTPAYMAPEQRNGATPSSATDQYSFCVTVFEALFGHRPDQDPHRANSAEASRCERSKSELRLCARVRPVLERGFEQDPNRRFDSMPDLLRALDRSVTPRTPRVLSLSIGLAAVSAAVLVLAVPEADPEPSATTDCTNADKQLRGIWDAPQKQAIGDAFAAISKPFADESWVLVQRNLDAYTTSWTAAYARACEATHILGSQTDLRHDARMRCLWDRRAELNATVSALREVNTETAELAIDQVVGLGRIERCDNADALLADVAAPSDPRKAFRAQQLRKRLYEAQAWKRAGKFEKARKLAASAIKEASALDYPPLEAEATATLAETHDGLHDIDEAVALLKRAHMLATEAGDDITAARAAAQLLAILSTEYSRFEEAETWSRHAQAALERRSDTGGSLAENLQGELYNSIGIMLSSKGEYKKGSSYFAKALETKRDVLGEPHVEIAIILLNLGVNERLLGNTQEAIKLFEQSAQMHRDTVGEYHPNLMRPIDALASLRMLAGELEAAEALYAEVLEIARGSVGLDDVRAIEAVQSAGSIAARRGDLDRALRLSTDALARCRRVVLPTSVRLAQCRSHLAVVYALREENEKAREQYARTLEILREAVGIDHPDTATIESGLGSILLRLHRFDEAKAHIESALKTRTMTLGEHHFEVGSSYGDLAELNTEQGNYDEALHYYRLARDIFATTAGEHHPHTRAADAGIAFMLLETNRPAEAIERFRRALAHVEGSGQRAQGNIATTEFGLAQALVGGGGDRKEALELAAKSLAFFRSAGPGFAETADEVARWLRQQK